jgi:amidohydrolase
MFQPGEESPGGAEPMIAEGVLTAAGEPAVAAYCLHVFSATYPTGRFGTRSGAIGAACDTVRVVVRGTGGHGSQPFQARDPIPAACEMVTALQTFVTRSFDVFDPVVISVGSFHAGTADNVIPEEAQFAATVRSFSAAARERLQSGIQGLLIGIAAAHGLAVEIDYELGYPVTVNDAAEAEFAAQTIIEMFGADRFTWLENPEPGSEDMAYVLERVPGAYLDLGACAAGLDPATAAANHAPDAVFDESVIPDGAALLAELAVRRLERG